MNTQPHQPVLLAPVIDVLAPQAGETFLDGTAGYGGHAAEVIKALGPSGRAILVDRDANAIRVLAERFSDQEIIHADFLKAADRLLKEGRLVDLILLDLGVSSPQIDNADRGFSFRADAPLDMRMDQSQSYTAADVVNQMSESDLERIIRSY